jgi:hypothetical protein
VTKGICDLAHELLGIKDTGFTRKEYRENLAGTTTANIIGTFTAENLPERSAHLSCVTIDMLTASAFPLAA